MLLETITGPGDLRELGDAELEQLAGEIRAFIVQSVSVTGGHLGSNLGVVELTLALHRVFDSPKDLLLWDTGHQAYVHKLVTGRRDSFATLRQPGGLSGYPSRAESEHDWVENSHASTILGYAHGMATGFALRGERDRQVVVVLNDNGRSYAPTVSKLSESLTWLRLHPTFVRQRARLERLLQSVPMVGDRLERVAESAEAAVRELWEPPAFFEQLGVRYTGPIDGHDVEALERALTHAAEWDGPIVVHVRAQKGRGHAPALADEVKRLHDIGGVKTDSYTQTFSDAVLKAAEADDRVVAITAAMPDSTGLLPFGERFPDRFFDVGIAEQHAVTAGAGMAMAGLRPVVAIYSTFLTRAFDQVNLDVGLHRQPVVFAVDRAGITGDDGASHHGVLDLALLTKVPGMTVLAPSSAQELAVMFEDALAITDGPVAIRFPKTTARTARPDEVGSGLRARKARDGDGPLAILAVGKLLAAAEEAAEALAGEGVDATVWDVRVCKPLDPEMLADAARHRVVVTAEDGIREGGVGSAIADAVGCSGSLAGAPEVLVLGTPVEFLAHGKPDAILAELGLDGSGIATAARRALGAAAAPATSL